MPSPDMTEPSPSITCRKAGKCRAPLCPMDYTGAGHRQVWYPDEPVCSLEEFQELDWIVRQREIAAKAGSRGGFFTVRMLKSLRAVNEGILGMDPDSSPSQPGCLKRAKPRPARTAGRPKKKTKRPERDPASESRAIQLRLEENPHLAPPSGPGHPAPSGRHASPGSPGRTGRRPLRRRPHRMNASRKVL